jgi:release factor glutamine methyltransferase
MTPEVKTVRDLVRVTAEYLADKGVDSARLNAERLLADVVGLSRIELYVQHDRPVMGPELDRYRDYVRRRAGGEPLQTILGETEFYSRPFKVEPGVFIPRPETELLVEAAVPLVAPEDRRLLAPLWATDLNPAAVDLTGRNARSHGVEARVTALAGSRFSPLPDHLRGTVDLLVSNPPYIRSADIAGLEREVSQHDPAAALDGGADGLDFYHALAAGCGDWLRPGGWIAVEIGDDQGDDVCGILGASGVVDPQVRQDYAGRDRIVTGCRPGTEA